MKKWNENCKERQHHPINEAMRTTGNDSPFNKTKQKKTVSCLWTEDFGIEKFKILIFPLVCIFTYKRIALFSDSIFFSFILEYVPPMCLYVLTNQNQIVYDEEFIFQPTIQSMTEILHDNLVNKSFFPFQFSNVPFMEWF